MKNLNFTEFYIKSRNHFRQFLIKNSLHNSIIVNFFVRIDLVIRATGILNKLLTGKINFRGFHFYYGKKDSGIPEFLITNGSYEEVTLRKIEEILEEGNIFFDLGSNIGFFSVLASCSVGSKGKIYSFEPTPETREYLAKNIISNNIKNVKIESLAISNVCGKAYFDVTENSECNSIIQSDESHSRSIEIETTSIDDYCIVNNIDSVDLIKMDIEGQEYNALLGMEEINKKSNNLKIIFEFNAENIRKNKQDSFLLFHILKEMGFTKFTILLDDEKSFSVFEDFTFLLEIAKRHNMNILASKY
jgi:FkbM family methyltransferase